MLGSPSLTNISKNTSTCGGVLTENKLEPGRKTHTTKVVNRNHTESSTMEKE